MSAIRAPLSQTELLERLQEVLEAAQSGRLHVLHPLLKGAEEYWFPGTLGECEQVALACRHLAKELHGLDTDLLFCNTEEGDPHLVCCRQGWVLDLRRAWVVRRDSLPYLWLALGRPDGSWHPVFQLQREQE